MKLFSWAAAILVLLFAGTLDAFAFLRADIADATLVERAELIVIGHIERGSITIVPHKSKADLGRSWHHTARLKVTETLKGSNDSITIPIYIEYGLTPIVGDTWEHPDGGSMRSSPNAGRGLPKDRIEIVDTGDGPVPPIVDDAREDNIWFLHKGYSGSLGIHDPQDLQPLRLKEYFQCYLASDPESSVRTFLWQNPEVAKRAQEYLDHLEIQRINKIEDTTLRAQRLLPYYLLEQAGADVVACGKSAGPVLLSVFVNDMQSHRRSDVIYKWKAIDFKEAAPILIDMLKNDNEYMEKWQQYNAKNGTKREPTGFDMERYSNDLNAIWALHKFQDVRARAVIEKALSLWKKEAGDNTQIIEACEAALLDLQATAAN
jgi:hypothetical protein